MQRRAIAWTVVACPLGSLLVAATPRGICNVRLGSDPQRLRADLEAELAPAALEPDPERLAPWVDGLLRYLRGEAPEPSVPLDVAGSPFQRRVWTAIRAIPYAATRSYAELAQAIGRPRAARAVAAACARNPVPLAVPCHRVIASGGRLGGYRYGVSRKRALLARERDRASRSAQSASATAMPN